MLNFKPLQPSAPRIVFKAPREWLPRLRALLDAHPQDDLASTEAMCCRLVGDFTAGIVLHRLFYWIPRGIRSDNAIWKSDREWYAELNLSYAQMKRVRARLSPVVKSWLEMAQGAPTFHYQLRVDALIRGIATVLNCSTVAVKLGLLEKIENGLAEPLQQSRESITIQHQKESDERLNIYHPYLKRFVGFTPQASAKLADEFTRLGESAVREVLKRCEASRGTSWQYVLRALENATPSRAPIPLYDTSPVQADDFTITDQMTHAWETSEQGRAWASRLDEADKPQPVSDAEAKWNQAYSQLEIQLDRTTFENWLRGAHFVGYETGTYHIGVLNSYSRDMLQHRAYNDIQRVVSNMAGASVQLCFEVHTPAPQETVPLFKLLVQKQAAEQEFYRNWKGANNG